METKFTKGEWVVSPSDENYIADISDNFAIAKVFTNSFIQKGEPYANAKLIAQSPNMLEMLERCETWISNSNEDASILKDIRDLISKATE